MSLLGAALVAAAAMQPAAAQSCETVTDIDYNGGDMYETPGWGLPVVDTAACAELCSTTAGCKYFTHAWGNCYIKGLSAIKLVSPGAVSGTCGGAAAPAGAVLAALPGVAGAYSLLGNACCRTEGKQNLCNCSAL